MGYFQNFENMFKMFKMFNKQTNANPTCKAAETGESIVIELRKKGLTAAMTGITLQEEVKILSLNMR